VKLYSITRSGRSQLRVEEENWSKTTDIVGRFMKADLT